MAKRVQLIRHLAAAADAFIGKVGEITVNLTNNALRVHDGATAGGHEQARADASNLQAATAGQDGKMSATKFAEVEANTSGLAAHVGAGGTVHPDVTPSVAGFMSAADKTKLDTVETDAKDDQTDAEILALLLGVDGAGSGLDADVLDGAQPDTDVTPNTIVQRDANSRIAAAAPATGDQVTTKTYVDDADALKADKTIAVTAGAGLSGGGTLAAPFSLQLELNALTPITDLEGADRVAVADNSDSLANRYITITNALKKLFPAASGTLTLTANAETNANHALGATPSEVHFYLECLTTDADYTAGDNVQIGGQNDPQGVVGITCGWNATQVFIKLNNGIQLVTSGGVGQGIDLTDWQIRWRAWL